MAVRVVTDFTRYLDTGLLIPRKQILQATPDTTLNDQQFVLEIQQIVVCDLFSPLSSTADAWTEIRRYYTKNRDLCGIAATDALCPFYVLAWTSAAATQMNVRIVGPGGTSTINIAASTTSKIWRGPATGNQLATNGTIEEQVISIQRTAGVGTCYLGGVCLISDT